MNNNNNNSGINTVTDSLLSYTKTDVQSYTLMGKGPDEAPSITLHSTGSEAGLSSSSAYLVSTKSEYNGDLSESSQSYLSRDKDDNGTVQSLHRHLTLLDLISIGVASTVGSGIFVLCGLIAHDYAGPSTFICWAIAGVSCGASGLCYAELSGKFPTSGSTYSYVRATMGKLPALAAGACLTLEYTIASSAVARSWGDKLVAFILNYCIDEEQSDTNKILNLLQPGHHVNPMAFGVSLASVALLLLGVKESKQVTNFFTVSKLILIAFMSIVSLSLMNPQNLTPILPAKFGINGILRGSTSSFFGYIGFDEICCLGGEVINPKQNLPRAVMGTISLVTVLYVVAAIGLVGMVPYQYISSTSGFPDGFKYRGYDIIAEISALGEIMMLPIVVLVTLMAQPRLLYAMAKDRLLPQIFAKVNETGNLYHGTLISGTVMIIVATCVPFTYLNDLISAGVLTAFSMTAASVILLRCESPKNEPFRLEKSLLKFNILSVSMGLLTQKTSDDLVWQLLPLINFLMLLALVIKIGSTCPQIRSKNCADYFETPFVPYLPLVAQFLNCYLIGQLGIPSIIILVGYVMTPILLHLLFGSEDNNNNNISTTNNDDDSVMSQISMVSIEKVVI